MTASEAAEILAAEGADVASATIHDVWNRTEGWPVALYLAAQSAGTAWLIGAVSMGSRATTA